MVGGVGRTSGGAVATLRTTFDRTPPDTLGTTKGFVRLVTLLTAVRVSLKPFAMHFISWGDPAANIGP